MNSPAELTREEWIFLFLRLPSSLAELSNEDYRYLKDQLGPIDLSALLDTLHRKIADKLNEH